MSNYLECWIISSWIKGILLYVEYLNLISNSLTADLSIRRNWTVALVSVSCEHLIRVYSCEYLILCCRGLCFFRGPWLVTPPEIPHAPTRLFYKQEVFLSTLEDTNTVDSIVGKCAVLEHGEYISCEYWDWKKSYPLMWYSLC